MSGILFFNFASCELLRMSFKRKYIYLNLVYFIHKNSLPLNLEQFILNKNIGKYYSEFKISAQSNSVFR